MTVMQKVKEEIISMVLLMFYFFIWIGTLVLLKTLILDEYRIEFKGFSLALVGALVLAKVVLVLEHVSLGNWVRNQPALLNVALRTLLYTFGVFVVLVIEKAFEGRHEYGGFISSLVSLFQRTEGYHVWANAICISGALLFYNLFSVLKRNLGEGELHRIYLKPAQNDL